MTTAAIGRVCGRGPGSVSGVMLSTSCDIAFCQEHFEYLEQDRDPTIRQAVLLGWRLVNKQPSRHVCPTHAPKKDRPIT